MTILCTICARGGSEGVPGKNIRVVGGLPLLAHSLEAARRSGRFSAIVVDSDCKEIRRIAVEHGASLVLDRPPALATSRAGKLPVIARAWREAERLLGSRFEVGIDLDVTSPLRSDEDIDAVIELLKRPGVNNVVTVTPAHRSPYFNLVEERPNGTVALSKASSVLRRQDTPVCYDMNASIYGWHREPFLERPFLFGEGTYAYVMPRERSVDVDDALDLRLIEILLEERSNGATA